MMQWEYRRMNLNALSQVYELNKAGEDGWELINVVFAYGILIAYLKRPKQ